MSGRRNGAAPTLIRGMLTPMSWIFRFVVMSRNWMFDQGWLCCYHPPVRAVISIGNIVAGGTGKTPVTLLFAKAFYDDYSIAILSRGYRSPAESLAEPLILSEGNGPRYPAVYSGDEPFMLSRRLPNATVIVGRSRRRSARLAASAGADIILIDDGMQHRRIARDFDVVVLDAADPFGKGYFLPRGFLREGMKALSRVHLVIVNHVESDAQFQAVKDLVKPYTSAPVIGTQWNASAVLDMRNQKIDSIQGKKVGMFCGIAHPEAFRITLQQLGANIVAEEIFPDHAIPNAERLAVFAEKCSEQRAEWIVCTEKDRVKLDDAVAFRLPIIWVQMELQVVKGVDAWNAFLGAVKKKIR